MMQLLYYYITHFKAVSFDLPVDIINNAAVIGNKDANYWIYQDLISLDGEDEAYEKKNNKTLQQSTI